MDVPSQPVGRGAGNELLCKVSKVSCLDSAHIRLGLPLPSEVSAQRSVSGQRADRTSLEVRRQPQRNHELERAQSGGLGARVWGRVRRGCRGPAHPRPRAAPGAAKSERRPPPPGRGNPWKPGAPGDRADWGWRESPTEQPCVLWADERLCLETALQPALSSVGVGRATQGTMTRCWGRCGQVGPFHTVQGWAWAVTPPSVSSSPGCVSVPLSSFRK